MLTNRARGPYWGILARRPIFPSTARASSVSKLFIIWHSVSDSKMQWHSVSDSKMQLEKRFVTESDKSSC